MSDTNPANDSDVNPAARRSAVGARRPFYRRRKILPVLRPERAEDRLQGRPPAVAASCPSAARSCRRRITAVSAKKQRELAQAIKRARFLALLPYILA